MVMADEHAQVGGAVETLGDPSVVLAPDLPLVDVGLGGVDRDERDIDAAELRAQPRVARAELLLEADVARRCGRRGSPARARSRDIRSRASSSRASGTGRDSRRRSGLRHDDEIRRGRVDLLDRRTEELEAEAPTADVHVR
jgi:hypothetical protein